MIKLIASDLDGSLLDANHKVPEVFWNTLEKLRKENIKFCVATGRSHMGCFHLFTKFLFGN